MSIILNIKKNCILRNFSNITKAKVNTIEKAYVEGIYADTPANRKLGRVGMSYKEYEKMVAGQKEEEKKEIKKVKNDIPENIQDLTFVKDEDGKKVATYSVNDSNITIEITSEEKYQDKQYKMFVEKKDGDNFIIEGNAAKIARQMKLLKNNQPFEHEIKDFRDILPLTPEELDAKWGKYYGFTYTYFKDNLDITVWKQDEKTDDLKNPHFNIYVKDINTKKTKRYTNLPLDKAHEKLLEFDLNPDIDKPLTNEQLKKKKEILLEEKFGKLGDKNLNENYISPILEGYVKGNKLINPSTNLKLDGYDIYIDSYYHNADPKSHPIKVSIKKSKRGPKDLNYEKKLAVNNLGELSKILEEVHTMKEDYNLSNESDLKPSKDIGIKFDSEGVASFINRDNETALKVTVNPEDPSQLTIHSYVLKESPFEQSNFEEGDKVITELVGIDTVSVDNFKDYLLNYDLDTDVSDGEQVDLKRYESFNQNLRDNGLKPKDIVEKYSNYKDLLEIPDVLYPEWDKDKAEKDPNVIASINSKHFNPAYHHVNRGKIDVIKFVKSKELNKWLDSLPPSNKEGVTKSKIIDFMNEKVDRMKYNSAAFDSVNGVTNFIIRNYY